MLTALFALALLAAPLEAELRSIAASFQGRVAMFAKNLRTGETAGVNAGERVSTASVIKLPIMVEAFYQVKEGKLRLDQKVTAQGENKVGGSGVLKDLSPGAEVTLEDAITLMIVLSDNSATNIVLEHVGIEAVNRRMDSLGLPGTRSFNKTFRRLPNPTEENRRYGIGSTTPAEMVKLLEMLERRELVDRESSEKMLAILKKQHDLDQIPRYLAGEKVQFALKSGALDALRNDVGIVYTRFGPVALAIFCYESTDRRWSPENEAERTIGKLARSVYDAWSPLYDTIIANARVVDGAGNPWYPGDVAIRDGKIARIAAPGSLPASSAVRVVDAGRQVVAPGFIDVHTHSEQGLLKTPTADNFILDGVTSIVTGNCGGSRADLARYFADLQRQGFSINMASLIGHNTVRREVMGNANRLATPEELRAMKDLVAKNMRAGAIGFSTGLIYLPGTYADTNEVVELARSAAELGGVYASHIRSEGDDGKGGAVAAIEEAIQVGRDARMPVEISHFKASGKSVWGMSSRTLQLVEDARRAGIEVTVDQYPYRASSTGIAMLIPSWALADDDDKVRQRLTEPASRRKIIAEMVEHQQKRRGFKSFDYAFVARAAFDPSLEGKNIAQITKERTGKTSIKIQAEVVVDLHLKSIEAGQGRVSMVYFSMSDEDVERIMKAPFAMVASDGGVTEYGVGVPHPRSYATNSRVLAHYVREKRVIPLEDAIRKMTSLPAQTFRLRDRGLLREGFAADLVVFDPGKVSDKATFEKPHQYSEGFSWVFVNGEPVVADGKHTKATPGQILYGPGREQ